MRFEPRKISLRFAAAAIMALALAAFPAAAAEPPAPPVGEAMPSGPVSSVEEIRAFAADIQILSDGRIAVTEVIDYFFPSPRHGIYRDLPLAYRDDKGNSWRIPLEVTAVTDENGKSQPYTIERSSAAMRVKIDDPDKTVSGGQTYVIFYNASGALRYFSDHDELYWNVTGTGWQVPIRRATASVKMPPGADAAEARKACYTGPAGSTRSDCRMNVQGDRVEFAASEPLTVVVGWPPGLVAKLEAEKISPWLPYWPLVVPVIVAGVMFFFWRKYGRDPHRSKTLVVQYEAPKGMTPAEAGTLIDERADYKDIAATMVDLAVRGFIRIRETERPGLIFDKAKDFELDRLKTADEEARLKSYERRLIESIFGLARNASFKNLKDQHAFMADLMKMMREIFKELVEAGYFATDPNKVRAAWGGVGVVFGFIYVYFLADAVVAAFAVDVVATYVAGIMVALLLVAFGFGIPRKTQAGADAEDHLRGYREYIDKAEKYRSQWQEKENIFEKTLPYAMAFGIVGKWAKAFEGATMSQPTWYEGSAFHAGAFNAVAFNSAFSSLNSSFNSALTSRPSQSSGGSGFSGGFSGGGGGGGGGGSW